LTVQRKQKKTRATVAAGMKRRKHRRQRRRGHRGPDTVTPNIWPAGVHRCVGPVQ